jgi:hypothetical protein
MAFNRVNPPEQALLPDIKESGLFNFLKELRFIVFQLWKRTGAGEDYFATANSNEPIGHTLSKLFDIRQQIGSGIPVTIDTTGFTIDSAEQTTDKTEV